MNGANIALSIYIGFNEEDEALSWLEQDVDEQSSYATFNPVDPVYDDLRDNARFKAILKRLNLPE